MTGEEKPPPISNRHKTLGFWGSDVSAGASCAGWPVRSGPRHCGQSPARNRLWMENRAKLSQKRNEPFMVRALITATDGQAQLDSAHLILFQKRGTKQAGATSRSGEMPGAQ